MVDSRLGELMAYLREISQQDARLYRAVEQQLAHAGTSSLADWADVPRRDMAAVA